MADQELIKQIMAEVKAPALNTTRAGIIPSPLLQQLTEEGRFQ